MFLIPVLPDTFYASSEYLISDNNPIRVNVVGTVQPRVSEHPHPGCSDGEKCSDN